VGGDCGGEVVLVDQRVVIGAEQGEVEQGSGSAVDPVSDVKRPGTVAPPSGARKSHAVSALGAR